MQISLILKENERNAEIASEGKNVDNLFIIRISLHFCLIAKIRNDFCMLQVCLKNSPVLPNG